jgi:hypothetical protein
VIANCQTYRKQNNVISAKAVSLSKEKHPPANASASLANFATLKMEAILSSETSVNTKPTQRHIPEDDILQRGGSAQFSHRPQFDVN